jgi:SAM-dependent methyltransferase
VSDPQRPAEGEHGPPALDLREPEGRVVRLWRRLSLAALRPEIDAIAAERARRLAALDESTAVRKGAEVLAARVAALHGEVERLAGMHEEVERLAGMHEEVERLANAHEEFARHLDTRIGQSLAEVADLRNAFLTVRAEFEQARDHGLPELASRADGLGATAATLQREIEALRDARLPQAEQTLATLQREIEALRDARFPQAEQNLERHQAALDALSAEIGGVRDYRVPQAEGTLELHQASLVELSTEIKGLRDERLPQAERGLAVLQVAFEGLQNELGELRELRMAQAEDSLSALQAEVDRVHAVVEGVQVLGEEVRDQRLPALSARVDALIGKLHEDLTAAAGLVDRLVRHEPLHVVTEPALDARIPAAVAAASQRFIDLFRGPREEILGRVTEHMPLLREAAPVLDLGCGRGELLEVLRDAGVASRGVDSDPAMVASCRQRGLEVSAEDALDALRGQAPESLGGVAAIHLLEHLPAARWMTIVDTAASALRPGGVLLVECPNPESLRVGGSLFWIDPTHHAPIHPEALAFVVRALGLEVVEVRFLHPFPSEQTLARPGQPEAVSTLAKRLEAWLSGPRDFVLLARKPAAT